MRRRCVLRSRSVHHRSMNTPVIRPDAAPSPHRPRRPEGPHQFRGARMTLQYEPSGPTENTESVAGDPRPQRTASTEQSPALEAGPVRRVRRPSPCCSSRQRCSTASAPCGCRARRHERSTNSWWRPGRFPTRSCASSTSRYRDASATATTRSSRCSTRRDASASAWAATAARVDCCRSSGGGLADRWRLAHTRCSMMRV